MKRITIQGIAGCFHETAAHGSFPGEEVEVLPCVSFDEQFARMADDAAVRTALIAPIAKELRETTSRVPFSD